MPMKQGDPESFLIPCSLETGITYNALAYLGAAISVRLLSMCTKVGIGLLSCTNLLVLLMVSATPMLMLLGLKVEVNVAYWSTCLPFER